MNVDLIAYPGLASRLPKATRKEMSEGVQRSRCNLSSLPLHVHGEPHRTARRRGPRGILFEGLPIGFQLYGDAFDEASISSGLAHLERVGFARIQSPRIVF